MADAYVIENAGQTAGIVVLERGGARFYSSDRRYNGLDGQLFRNLRAARNAVVGLQRGTRMADREEPVLADEFTSGQRQLDAGHRTAA